LSAQRLCVVQLIPALDAGGAERSTLEVAQALVAAGHRSVVISAGGRLVDTLLAQGSEHVTLELGRKSLATLAKAPALRRELAHLAPDVVHVRSRLPAWGLRLALPGLAHRPHVVSTVHGLNSPGWYSAILVRAERVICVSDTVAAHVRTHYGADVAARTTVIPRGVDPAEFPFGHRAPPDFRARLDDELPQLKGRKLLLMPARGTRLKGHHRAIELTAALEAAGHDVALLLLGVREAGRERYVEELEALAAQLGVARRIAMTQPRGGIRDFYAISDLVLQLSRKPEAFGRTVVEALSIGVPVLGWAHGGAGELLKELFPAGAVPLGDSIALAQRAGELLRERPVLAPLERYRRADMQRATLAVYADVCAA
jgi:glycosyltransferase involved in cell wall biosynthesis